MSIPILPPHAILSPRVFIAVAVEDGNDGPLKVVNKAGNQLILTAEQDVSNDWGVTRDVRRVPGHTG